MQNPSPAMSAIRGNSKCTGAVKDNRKQDNNLISKTG